MQENVGFACESKQRHIATLEMLKHFIPSAQVDKSSGNQIVCNIIWKCEVRWMISKQLI